jgi:DNA replication protein DnaC
VTPGEYQKARPEVRRSIAGIPQALRVDLRACVVGEAPWPLFIHGPAGVGKTCAGLCLLDYAGGEYHTAAGLCALLIQSQQGRLEWHHEGYGGTLWPEKLWQRLRRAPLVVLDEIGGRDRISEHHYEAVKTLLDERAGRPLLVMSNLSVPEIERLYDDRIASRLAAGTVVELTGQDRRLAR